MTRTRQVTLAWLLGFLAACGMGILDERRPDDRALDANGASDADCMNCDAGVAEVCTPRGCGNECGPISDGCGRTLACGACSDAGDASVVDAACIGRSPGTWFFETADAQGNTGLFPSLAVDVQGTVHVSYYDDSVGSVRYARRSPAGGWMRVTVSEQELRSDAGVSLGDIGMGTTLALERDGTPTIAYYDPAVRVLRFARLDSGGVWRGETVDSDGDVGTRPSSVIDAEGVHLLYGNESRFRLKIAHRNTGTKWSVEVVDDDYWVPGSSSIAADESGLHIFHCAERRSGGGGFPVYVQRPHSGGFRDRTELVHERGRWLSVAADVRSGVHLAYRMNGGELLYLRRPGGGGFDAFHVDGDRSVDPAGASVALGLDALGRPNIAYLGGSELRYAIVDGAGKPTITVLDTPGQMSNGGRYVALAVDARRAVHLAYYDQRTGDLRYARRCD